MADQPPTASDAWLDLLADAVARRLDARRAPADAAPMPPVPPAAPPAEPAEPPSAPVAAPVPLAEPEPDRSTAGVEPEPTPDPAPESAGGPHPRLPELPFGPVPSFLLPDLAGRPRAHDAGKMVEQHAHPTEPQALPVPSGAAPLMARLAVGVLLVVALINIPFNADGLALARSVPPASSLIIRNGLLVKEPNSPEVWVYRDGAFHWITSLDVFTTRGYRWEDVHVVEPGFLRDFERGAPDSVLLKCVTSPHIYLIQDGRKRWIVDLATFGAEGYRWQDVRFVDCLALRSMPDGDTIPPGRGRPPPPRP